MRPSRPCIIPYVHLWADDYTVPFAKRTRRIAARNLSIRFGAWYPVLNAHADAMHAAVVQIAQDAIKAKQRRIGALEVRDTPQPLAKRLCMWFHKKWKENVPLAEWMDERWSDSVDVQSACWRMMIARLYPGYDYTRSHL